MTKPTGNPRGRPPKARQDAETHVRGDGWNNVMTNLGAQANNRTSATKYKPDARLDHKLLANMFRGDGLAKRIVSVQVDDALREWIEADDKLIDELARIKAKSELAEALYWSRLFGGSVVVALIDDGLEFDQPVNMNGIRRVLQLRTYERQRVTWDTASLDNDPSSRTFGMPTVYRVQPINGMPYNVHHSRLWRFDGEPLPSEQKQQNQGWGDSVLQSVYEALRNYGNTMNASAEIVQDFIQTVLGIKGLTDMLRQGQDDLVAKRAIIIDLTRSVANTIFTDAEGETYDKKASSVAGLADLWDRFALHISSVTGIPATKLLGRSPSGLNATGDNEMRQWYDVVHAYRTDEMQPFMRWLCELLDAQTQWRGADRPDEITWQWPSLWQPTEEQWADIKLKTAQADAVYMDRQAANPAYLYHLRYGSDEFRPDVKYTVEGLLQWEQEVDQALGGDDEAI